MSPFPPETCPSGFTSRPARPDEADAIARAHWDIRSAAFAGFWPKEVVERRSFEERLAGWKALLGAPDLGTARFALVLEDGDAALAGFVTAGPAREEMGPWTGQVYQLYLREGARGRGLGRRLLEKGRSLLRAAGHERSYLWTPGQNTLSRGFYEHCGGRFIREEPLPPHATATRVGYGFSYE